MTRDLVQVNAYYLPAGSNIRMAAWSELSTLCGWLVIDEQGQRVEDLDSVYVYTKRTLQTMLDDEVHWGGPEVCLTQALRVYSIVTPLDGSPMAEVFANNGLTYLLEDLEDIDRFLVPYRAPQKYGHFCEGGVEAQGLFVYSLHANQDYWGEWDAWEELDGLLDLGGLRFYHEPGSPEPEVLFKL